MKRRLVSRPICGQGGEGFGLDPQKVAGEEGQMRVPGASLAGEQVGPGVRPLGFRLLSEEFSGHSFRHDPPCGGAGGGAGD